MWKHLKNESKFKIKPHNHNPYNKPQKEIQKILATTKFIRWKEDNHILFEKKIKKSKIKWKKEERNIRHVLLLGCTFSYFFYYRQQE